MSLTELIAGIEAHEQVLTAFNASDETVSALREQFHDRNIAIESEETASGKPDGFVVLSDDGELVTAAAVETILAPDDERTDPGFEGDPYKPILDHLDETMFTSYDIEQMVAASREIEDRAWRIGTGSLYSGFQRLSILHEQMDIYEQLAEKEASRSTPTPSLMTTCLITTPISRSTSSEATRSSARGSLPTTEAVSI